MRTVRIAGLMIACLMLGWAAGAYRAAGPTPGKLTSFHTGVTVEQVQALSQLVTTRVDVADVQETRLEGRTGSIKTALIVKGDFLLGTDLSAAVLEEVDADARTAVLVLPQPQVTSPRLDHERTKVFGVSETGLWQITPSDNDTSAIVIQRAYAHAQRYIAEAANDPSLLARSRAQAETVLATFFHATGWRVSVRWADRR